MNSKDEIEIEADIDELQQWFIENENLPKQIERILLKRFYLCQDGDMDATRNLLLKNYHHRNKYRKLFIERDSTNENTLQTFEYAQMMILPGLTSDNCKITMYRVTNYSPSCVHFIDDVKTFLMVSDCRFSMPDMVVEIETTMTEIIAAGEILIFDMKGFAFRHLLKVSFKPFLIFLAFLQTCIPCKLIAVHFINSPSFVDRIVRSLRRYIHDDVFDLLRFHSDDIECLYDIVPQEMLPEEYGGLAGKCDDLNTLTVNRMIEKRDYLMGPENWEIENYTGSRHATY